MLFSVSSRSKRVRSSSLRPSQSRPDHEFPYAAQSPFWVYVIQCETPDRIQVGMTSDLPRRFMEHVSQHSGSPTITKHGVKEIIELLPVNTREEAIVLERATVMRYLQHGLCLATGGGVGEARAIQARNEHNLLKMGFHLKRKRSLWKRRQPRLRLPLELRRRKRRKKRSPARDTGA